MLHTDKTQFDPVRDYQMISGRLTVRCLTLNQREWWFESIPENQFNIIAEIAIDVIPVNC